MKGGAGQSASGVNTLEDHNGSNGFIPVQDRGNFTAEPKIKVSSSLVGSNVKGQTSDCRHRFAGLGSAFRRPIKKGRADSRAKPSPPPSLQSDSE